ncbi:nitrogen fixation protein FixH [Polaromonas sp.]|uniref:nitrogen fixation protein FixH n=1 Tax=Polaromonas sp. TaxID=1869339 RepID=UPI0013BC6A9A|nr:nitrogen fixation protein FixH [Polaromonas sp.]NDP62098.1 nitrogen fixation protein FixH [Polaromonas sp.]
MNKEDGQPWWKFGHVWMVFAGPAVVVVASFITLYLAIKIPDPVVTGYGQGSLSSGVKQESLSTNMAPAMQARNHAATGVPAPAEP